MTTGGQGMVEIKTKEDKKNIEQSKQTEECGEMTGRWAEQAEWKMMEGVNKRERGKKV